jgi:hypothetical protein
MLDDKATWQIRTEALECRASRIGLLSSPLANALWSLGRVRNGEIQDRLEQEKVRF